MFEDIGKVIRPFVIKYRTDVAEGQDRNTKPITVDTLVGCEPLALALKLIADSCGKVDGEATPSSIRDFVNLAAKQQTDYALIHGLPFSEVMNLVPLLLEQALDHAETNLDFVIRNDADNVADTAARLKIAIGPLRYLSPVAAEGISCLSIDLAAQALSLMFKAASFAHDREAYEKWVEAQSTFTGPGDYPADSTPIDKDDYTFYTPEQIVYAKDRILKACAQAQIAPPDVPWNAESLNAMRPTKSHFHPIYENNGSWVVGGCYHGTLGECWLTAIVYAINDDPAMMEDIFRKIEDRHKSREARK